MGTGKVILLVDDDRDNEALTLGAFKQSNILNELVVVRDGAQALDYLFGAGAHAGRNTDIQPQVVLLKLNLPEIGGLEVLRRIRAHPKTRLVPTVILTSSKEEQDRIRGIADTLGCNGYARGPIDMLQFVQATRHLALYWLLLNESPR